MVRSLLDFALLEQSGLTAQSCPDATKGKLQSLYIKKEKQLLVNQDICNFLLV